MRRWNTADLKGGRKLAGAFKRGPASHNLSLVPVTPYTCPPNLSTQFTSLHGCVAEQQYWFFFCFHFVSFVVPHLFASTQYSCSFLFSSIWNNTFIFLRTKQTVATHLLWYYSVSLMTNLSVLQRSYNNAWKFITWGTKLETMLW